MCQNKGKHRDGEEESGSESLVKGGLGLDNEETHTAYKLVPEHQDYFRGTIWGSSENSISMNKCRVQVLVERVMCVVCVYGWSEVLGRRKPPEQDERAAAKANSAAGPAKEHMVSQSLRIPLCEENTTSCLHLSFCSDPFLLLIPESFGQRTKARMTVDESVSWGATKGYASMEDRKAIQKRVKIIFTMELNQTRAVLF
ncbi:hypothetical protein MJG53_009443 [Ovis ammon polii x Ovis aries]|uniref:Uncharacterized protein n=1 Tax=Ovis ammon polii x Ovis aries TaxID=2918886 RepID=A0ACB9UWU7_9CETA|nr:hypothetical protein MJG53_009443 [Ovis ammon polii x Ovis aries]